MASAFAHMTLADLQVMLHDTLRHAEPQDQVFIRDLALEIARRIVGAEAEHARMPTGE